ncbi:hypothetical protein [Thermococcus sp.]|uniref:hypothetical protein n=1 Tax=Thermococcus sp. TaxID=35749 RepID=UPI00260D7D7A|nr:hypothetical protein [Thermococcus sp.]
MPVVFAVEFGGHAPEGASIYWSDFYLKPLWASLIKAVLVLSPADKSPLIKAPYNVQFCARKLDIIYLISQINDIKYTLTIMGTQDKLIIREAFFMKNTWVYDSSCNNPFSSWELVSFTAW